MRDETRDRVKLVVLAAVALGCIALYMLSHLVGNLDYILPRRLMKLSAIVLTGVVIAFSTVVFQTITNNRILTPSIIGLDALYMFINTVFVFLFGSAAFVFMDDNLMFLLSAGVMMLFSLLLYRLMFRRDGTNIFFVLLVGIVLGTFFRSATSFMQMLIDPNEFLVIQDRMFASFNNVKTNLLFIALLTVAAVMLYFLRFAKYLDVLALGRDHAINLGVEYDAIVSRLFVIVAALVSIATALVGPITFLGLIVANVAYQFMSTFRHRQVMAAAALISIVMLVGGQWVVERVFTFSTTLSVIINFVGGIYFLYLVLRESKA
ncbi:MAG: iron ABC transporter permease [Bacillaceae bacterium G1]|nr:iron ABC transporter permease [Bacillota bacterium]OJF18383.1 MAG: iron ABC transporter permease [Bacillaceae bacterium G1]